ncbi:sigma-54-dependent Fis family transcriptional regulator [Burkholderia cenocepacia]|uniref:Sigma-54-dependent Fis family transcriptional regulator n=2 Tax=Burkholderia cepacia complex TaxID=87882 RepID=A0AAD0NA37_9BURK|nr:MULTISPECIES: sigma-54 dependent transcriptional regulator [Burkholderia cepacia complex]EAY62397.1 Response regulator [Burkholderia cenocepacia PC184]ACA90275.1 two component, sigma54 specific, transcriptional regulator, Fis family [Burkholderia orbicola MC0-3]AWG30849.1 sigma-54-dependent Fis family transcriptional regulator [Burkholderia cenocepacia]MBR7992155.1 sigma-54-dependent Fis family transcriptional regulator [Burkholderia cenocepacia]MBR8154143.1 sigma-54-dependent Fis family tr
MPHALIVEDDPNSLSGLTALLAADGFSVDTATSLAEARTALGRSIPDVVLVDLNLPDGSGFDLLQHLPQQQPNGSLPVIVLTGNATVESAIEGLRHGIWDYLLKPINIPRLRSLLARIPRPYELIDEVQSLRASLRHLGRFGALVGRSDAMQHVYDMIEHNARTETAVLFSGEAGTGKKLAARTLHDLSRRRKGPFVSFDCRMLVQAGRHGASLDSVLFGHERGAFDGAERRETGLFEQAGGGTLFLDEITALPLVLQEALLHALDSQNFMRIGGTSAITSDFRLIAATRRPAREAVANGTLREDLWLRLDAASITMPPLRERDGDALAIADAQIDELNREARATGRSTTDKRAAPGFVRECLSYEWPGNVRELQERVRFAYDASGDFIETLRAGEASFSAGAALNGSSVQIKVGTPLSDVEDLLIRATLDAVGGTRHRAATLLGISPKTLYNKLQRMKVN